MLRDSKKALSSLSIITISLLLFASPRAKEPNKYANLMPWLISIKFINFTINSRTFYQPYLSIPCFLRMQY